MDNQEIPDELLRSAQILDFNDDDYADMFPTDSNFFIPVGDDEYPVKFGDWEYNLSRNYPLTPTQHKALTRTIISLNTNYMVKHEQQDKAINFELQQYHVPVLQKTFAGWRRQAIIKGRQVYMTTMLTLLMMEFCVYRPYFPCVVNNSTEPDQVKTLREKFAYVIEQSDWLKPHIKKTPTRYEVNFRNGANINCSMSGRSRTPMFTLITEASYTAEKDPVKFNETYVGTVNGGQYGLIFLETSPYGYNNPFIQMVRNSIKMKEEATITREDVEVEFVPWWKKYRNRVWAKDIIKKVWAREKDDKGNEFGPRRFPPEWEDYFTKIQREEKMKMDIPQRVYYIITMRAKCQANPLVMRQEHPSTIEEALQTFSGAYILRENMDIADGDGRVGKFFTSHSAPCAVFWDFGGGKAHTCFSIMQLDRGSFPNHYKWIYSFSERSADTLPVWFSRVNARRLNIRHHFLPHDAGHLNMTAKKLTDTSDITIYKAFKEAGIRNVSILPKIKEKKAGFEASNRFVYKCIFDTQNASNFVDALCSATRKWDSKTDQILEELDNNNPAAHTYDTFELAALADEGNYLDMLKYRPEGNDVPVVSETFDGAPI